MSMADRGQRLLGHLVQRGAHGDDEDTGRPVGADRVQTAAERGIAGLNGGHNHGDVLGRRVGGRVGNWGGLILAVVGPEVHQKPPVAAAEKSTQRFLGRQGPSVC